MKFITPSSSEVQEHCAAIFSGCVEGSTRFFVYKCCHSIVCKGPSWALLELQKCAEYSGSLSMFTSIFIREVTTGSQNLDPGDAICMCHQFVHHCLVMQVSKYFGTANESVFFGCNQS